MPGQKTFEDKRLEIRYDRFDCIVQVPVAPIMGDLAGKFREILLRLIDTASDLLSNR